MDKDFKQPDYSVINSIVPEEIERTDGQVLSGIHPTNQFWYDGKRIWREVVEFSSIAQGAITSVNASFNYDIVNSWVDFRQIWGTSTFSGAIYAGNFYSSSTNWMHWYLDMESPVIVKAVTGNSFATGRSGVAILEFTRNDRPN